MIHIGWGVPSQSYSATDDNPLKSGSFKCSHVGTSSKLLIRSSGLLNFSATF
jgi:hypothetical protein